jgi:transcription-repair coupling factor (superfamily II helicase)
MAESLADATASSARTLELPSDRRLLRVADAAREALARSGETTLVGAAGSGTALLARALLQAGARHVLYIAADPETALRATEDLRALASLTLPGGEASADEPAPLFLAGAETSPYAEVHPDRRIAMQRASALFTLAKGLPFRTIVTTAASLLRRVAPPDAILAAGFELVTDGELDTEAAAKRLTAAGYLRVPVVEDPGSFAVRGGVFDVWPANAEAPVRAELFGDAILSLKSFDPEGQRRMELVHSAWLPPARETVLAEQPIERARVALRGLCDDASFPSSKARALIDDLVLGRSFFGSEGFLPAFYDLVSLFEYLPPGTAVVVEDPGAVARAFER